VCRDILIATCIGAIVSSLLVSIVVVHEAYIYDKQVTRKWTEVTPPVERNSSITFDRIYCVVYNLL
jgi:hypothetical protein